ncbi:splicing factor ESS-2 homolog isoform X2 [Carcharodon carcharias]|uniref:splicing factor ESS-2 homolog isoform X2 n=1 Tax=Carcharodon carcharias TaxID=13397 RepID=UPI001B7E2D85|nr:splicing factor ESS-2 homolog isoform X2 [Carcharodon carcharias]
MGSEGKEQWSAAMVATSTESPGNGRSKKRILDEESYIGNLEEIIQRDFFPDVEKLRAQREYLEAEESGDMEKMREITIKYGSSLRKPNSETPAAYLTPASFETPEVVPGSPSSQSKTGQDGGPAADEEGDRRKEEKELPTLDTFLGRSTSEDNASFNQIIEIAEERNKIKHAWMYEAEEGSKQRREEMLMLPSAEVHAIVVGKAGVETWEYKAKNVLMYYPEGVKDDELFKKPREVVHKNTRFQGDPFSRALSKSQLQQAAALNAQFKQGKVGPDGKELIPQESPKVNGYGFVGTPSPAPGVNDSPMVTWGEIEGTPFRLESSESPHVDRTPGPAFKILEPGRRERLGLKMVNEVAAKNRTKKQEALRKATQSLVSLSPHGISPVMSPALQRLVNRTTSKYTDRALRASYTPTPAHKRTPQCKTPCAGGTPNALSAVHTPSSQDPTSITDNLLQLPRRKKAVDFS